MSSLKMEPSGRSPGTPAGSSPRGESSRDWEEVASALLEAGKELASLRDYFSNPGNFEAAFPQPPTALLGNNLGGHTCSSYMCTYSHTCS